VGQIDSWFAGCAARVAMQKDRIHPICHRPQAAGDPHRDRSPMWPPQSAVVPVALWVGAFHRDVAHANVGDANHCWVEHVSSIER
jgi:hypothetical protein